MRISEVSVLWTGQRLATVEHPLPLLRRQVADELDRDGEAMDVAVRA